MKAVYAYEIVAIALFALLAFYYSNKNWLYMYKNRIFSILLYTSALVTLVDLFRQMSNHIDYIDSAVLLHVFTVMSNIGVLILVVLLFIYYLAQASQMDFIKKPMFYVLLMPAVVNAGLVIASWTAHVVVIIFYLIASDVILYRNRYNIKYSHYIIMFISNIVMSMFFMTFYMRFREYMLMYYCTTAVLVMYYLCLHNADMYIVHSSGCFSMSGFKQMITEQINYHKEFYCLAVCLGNIESLSDYCLESEIAQIHEQLGMMLRKEAGRHHVYHVHSSEYILMADTEKEAEALFLNLRVSLPKTIRMNDKNVSLYYKFFILGSGDANGSVIDFMRILNIMKKTTIDTMADRGIVVYQGRVQDRIRRELDSVKVINEVVNSGKCELECMPVFEMSHNEITDLEVNPILKLDNGKRIPIENVWYILQEMGNSKDAIMMFWKSILQFASEQKIFERGIRHIRINLSTLHVASESICEEYMSLVEEYHINPDNIVMELDIDSNIPEEILSKSIAYFRKKGIHVVWDQFGVTACNLKNMMDMPFDGVKINHQIVGMYCKGESNQLVYLVRMLKRMGWSICLDGIEYPGNYNKVKRLDINYIQGTGFVDFIPEAMIREFLLKKGGILNDI